MSLELKHWLQSINLDQYLSDFKRAGYTTLDQCRTLTDDCLNQIGMTLPGHRKRVLAYLPKSEDFRTMADGGGSDDPVYGNLPVPVSPGSNAHAVTHVYVNSTPVAQNEPLYGNVPLPMPPPHDDSRSHSVPTSPHEVGLREERSAIVQRDGSDVFDDRESFYDVLPPPCRIQEADDAGDYVSISLRSPLEGAVGGVDLPPALPPKKNKTHRRSLDDAMGVNFTPDGTFKRPVPKPRTTVTKSQSSSSGLGGAEVSPRNSAPLLMPVGVKKDKPSPPMLKPIPKPRPRPTARGRKSQGPDSCSPHSSSSGSSPRHSPVPRVRSPRQSPSPRVPSPRDSPVPLPMPRATSPGVPREHAPSPPRPREHAPSPPKPPRQKVKAAGDVVSPLGTPPSGRMKPPTEPVTSPAIMTSPPAVPPHAAVLLTPLVIPPRENKPPPVEPTLSMETEVPPSKDVTPCDSTVKIPLPVCPTGNEDEESAHPGPDTHTDFWRVDSPQNHTYENAEIRIPGPKYENTEIPLIPEKLDPDEPEKLDDFIKSLMAAPVVPDFTSPRNPALPNLPDQQPVPPRSADVVQVKPELPEKHPIGLKDSGTVSTAVGGSDGSNVPVDEDVYQIPLPVIALQKSTTSAPSSHSESIVTSSAASLREASVPGSESNPAVAPPGSSISSFTTGWNKALGQPREKSPRPDDPNTVESESSISGEPRDPTRESGSSLSVSVSSESSIDRDKHDSTYGAVWFATSGGNETEASSVQVPQDVYDEIQDSDSRPVHLSFKRGVTPPSDANSRDSTMSSMSFNIPEPSFTPPPLPAGTSLEGFPRSAPQDLRAGITQAAAAQIRPAPVVPPRVRNSPKPAAGSVSEMGSSSSLASTQSQSSGSSVGTRLHTDPILDHRFSSTSFSDLAMQRVESTRRAAPPTDDKYEEIASPRPKPPRPSLEPSVMSTRASTASTCTSLEDSASLDISVPSLSIYCLAANEEPSHIYSPEPMSGGPAPPRCPPAPPPRNPSGSEPFQNLLTYSGASALYHGEDELSDCTSVTSVWESDDTLSDGGDFYDSNTLKHQKPSNLLNSIPVVPFTPTASLSEKKGICFKYGTMQSRRRGWLKRWLKFDGKTLRYYHDEKSPVSKRVIPVSSMVNIEQEIKHGEAHEYGFRLITVDRVYTFSVEDSDELSLWTCLLMKAIIDCEEKFVEGGDMNEPDLEGFVKMEGVKGKRYLTIKNDLLAYYNTYNDYKAGTPIHIIEMKLASVKNSGKNKLELRTPYATYGLSYDSNEELVNWKNALEESITEGLAENTILHEVYENHSNKFCADCGAPDPHWASINLGITVCKHCAGVHRLLTMPFSKVRSLRMDVKVWTPTLKQMLQVIGNDNSNNFWEWNSTEDDRIDSDCDMNERRDYVVAKYEEKQFCRLHPLRGDESAMNDALCKSVRYGDVLETMQLIFSGADILCTTNRYGGENVTPSQLARRAKQTIQMEFLYQNGAEGSGQFPATTSIRSQNSDAGRSPNLVKMKGYLLKTGPNQRDFHKRWCILEHGILTYFENERALVAKDSIVRSDMMSVSKVKDERQEFAFELGTTKGGGRVYLFAAETHDERQKWIVKLAKVFAPLPIEVLQQIRDVHRAGMVYLREGATMDWQMTWIQLKERCFSVFNKESKALEEIDLRKVIAIKSLSETEQDDIFQDKSPPFVMDLHKRAIYIKGDCARETKAWFTLLEKIASESGGYLIEQQLTVDEVPVIVDKCINFVSTHGLKTEGIYRKNGIHSRVTLLVQNFRGNAREVHLRLEDYDVHDVATTLKRYFRSLEEPLLTSFLYAKWTNTCNISDFGAKMQWYKYLLGELPAVHYSTLKRVISHLARITEFQDDNKMTKINLASIFGPVLMNQEKGDIGEHNTTTGFGATQQEINVILDLLDNNRWLFEVNDAELEHERKMQEAVERIQKANEFRQTQAGELLMGVYVHNKEGHAVTLKISADMTGEGLLDFVVEKASLDANTVWGLFEVVCDDVLERPIHFLEKVLDVTLRWTEWPEDFCRENYLVVKENYVYSNVDNVFDPHCSLFEELKYSERKGFKKFCFEFSQYKLTYQKDPRATSSKNSWNVEDLIIYLGVDQKRSPSSRYGLTFIASKEKVAKNKETPFFGHSLVFATQEDQYRWLAAMLHAQHPGGLTRDGTPFATGAHGSDTHIPSPQLSERPQSPWSRAKSKSSFISRFIKR